MSNIRLAFALTAVAIAGLAYQSHALPNVAHKAAVNPDVNAVLRGTAATCAPATATIDLDINNVRARLMTGGDMWWDIGTGTARYEVPKNSHKNSLFAGSIWVGGTDDQNNLKVAAQSYRQNGNDYWPGPLNTTNTTDKTQCSDWDRFWKVNKSDVLAFRELVRTGGAINGSQYDVIKQWPASGNGEALGVSGLPLDILTNSAYSSRSYAPFVDVNGNGIYEWAKGDYPDILGDQYIWWVFNDAGNSKLESQTGAIGIEVQASAFAFSSKDYLNDATFYNYRLINRGNTNLNNTYVATWTDADLGYAFDDYIGCDTVRSLGILYNGKSVDGNGEVTSYGTEVPMVGVDFFVGPKRKKVDSLGHVSFDTLGMTVFNYFNNDFSPIGNPTGGVEIYNIMSGFSRRGIHIHNDFSAGQASTGFTTGPLTNFVFPGNPNNNSEWSECSCNRKPDDRRFVHSSGPFVLESGGVTNDVTIGAVWVADVGGCPNANFTKIRAADDQAQNLFDNHFRTIEGPEAPRLIAREMDRKIIFYIVNDSTSTNFQEKFGNDTAAKYRVSTAQTRKYKDSLYKFQGYRVFQLKNSNIKPSQIFAENGTVDKTVAAEVFQSDVKDGVSQIVNYTKAPDKGPNVYDASVKVIGKDSGIVHSFALTNDAFANKNDKRFVNYRNYYFVAIAYSYNNFRNFTYASPDSSQQVAYLESNHAAGGTPIPVVVAMPNPANGDMGTQVNSDYGSGVVIKREEGIGNGHNSLQIDDSTERTILGTNSYAPYPTYMAGMGPVNVKVVDPRKVPLSDWELYIYGPANSSDIITATTGQWKLVNHNSDGSTETIYNEQNLSTGNEQILEKYGLSVQITQVKNPGEEQLGANSNGYIGSSVSFQDPGKLWLAGVRDGEQRSYQNWIRSGKNKEDQTTNPPPCDFDDFAGKDTLQAYESLFPDNSILKATWAPYTLAAVENRGTCGFGVAYSKSSQVPLTTLPSIDVVFTSDKTKWTRSAVIELQDDPALSEGKAAKFSLRSHASWNMGMNGNDPAYATDRNDTGMSWFPGYAVNQETGERLNIVFGEDSYQKSQNGRDMIWNPTATILDDNQNVVFGGKHYVYVLGTKYDQDAAFAAGVAQGSFGQLTAYKAMQWVGLPTLNAGFSLLSLKDGLIPTETRLRFRVDRPYAKFVPVAGQALKNNGFPLYTFTTKDIAPKPLSDAGNQYANDKQALLDQMHAVPNPYYGYTGYETNRLDTRIRIVNLPRRATVSIYSLDGALIRRLEKDNPNQSFVDWDIRNAKGLPIASGMYLIHINAEGIGETVLRWFGSMRPLDITTY